MKPPNPGEVLLKDFMRPYKLSYEDLHERINIKPAVIKRNVVTTGEASLGLFLRLAKLFGTTEQVWLDRALAWQLHKAKKRHKNALQKIVCIRNARI